MKRRKGYCCGSPNDRAKHCWFRGFSIGLLATMVLVCLVAQAQERDAGRPDNSPELAVVATVPLADGGTSDVAIGSNQAPATVARGTEAIDASVPPVDSGQADLSDVPDGSPSPTPSPIVTGTISSSGISAESPQVLYGTAKDSARARLPYAGLGLDLGVSGVLPDTGLLLTLRPGAWLQLQLGPGYNGLSPGLRAGATLVNPFVIPLSFTVEGGHYYEGDANRAVHWFSPETKDVASLRHFSYDYVNLLGGLAFEGRHFCFYLRGGVTWMRTTVKNFSQSVNEVAQVDLQASDPKIHYRGPSAKIGFLVFP